MKYSTKLVYGIPPAVLANMRHVDALNACKNGGKLQLKRFSKPSIAKWGGRRMALVAYINKSLEWVDEKLKEMK